MKEPIRDTTNIRAYHQDADALMSIVHELELTMLKLKYCTQNEGYRLKIADAVSWAIYKLQDGNGKKGMDSWVKEHLVKQKRQNVLAHD